MDRKKLLTLASAIGILACGACFLPPPRPARIHLRGFQGLLVTATDRSGASFVDVGEFGQSVAAAVNTETRSQSLTARFGGQAAPDDAVLPILVVAETAASEPASPGLRDWNLSFAIDATVTSANGSVLGHLPSRYFRWQGKLPASSAEVAWRDPRVRAWLNNAATQIARDLLRSDGTDR